MSSEPDFSEVFDLAQSRFGILIHEKKDPEDDDEQQFATVMYTSSLSGTVWQQICVCDVNWAFIIVDGLVAVYRQGEDA